MKILYLISCFGHGRGGHFYSLRTTAEEMSKEADVVVASVGTGKSPVLSKLDNYIPLIESFPSPRTLLRLMRVVKRDKVDVIHSFDVSSYLYARLVSFFSGVPVLLSKCGGPKPKRYFPLVTNLVVFSEEDFDFFQKKGVKNISLIPNRVSEIECNEEKVKALKVAIGNDYITFLRISRFSKHHEKSILGAVELVGRLVEDGYKSKLILIGSVQDQAVYERLVGLNNKNLMILSSDEYTINSSEVIDVAEYVIGTGRGAMEAAIKGKTLLSPVNSVNLPVLVDEKKITSLFRANFSDRAEIANLTEGDVYEEIVSVIKDRDRNRALSAYLKKFSEENFEIRSVRKRYIELYRNCRACDIQVVDTFKHGLAVLKQYMASKKTKENSI